MITTLSPRAVGLLATLLFFLYTLFLQLSNRARDFDNFSELLVTGSVERAAAEKNIYFENGFMYLDAAKYRTIGIEFSTPRDRPYLSQFGLQYKTIALFPRFLPISPKTTFIIARTITILLCSSVMGWIAYWCAANYGSVAAAIFSVLTLGATHLHLFSASLYWVPFGFLLPFAFSLNLYPRLREKPRWFVFLGAVFVFVSLKSLCGYEYLSVMTLAVTTPIVFYELLRESRYLLIFQRMLQVFFASVGGFAVALSLHFWQRAAISDAHDLHFVFKNIIGTSGEIVTVKTVIRRFTLYMFADGVVMALCGTFLLLILLKYSKKIALSPTERKAYIGFLIMAPIASLSWNSIMWSHMQRHAHINSITFYMCWYPVLLLIIAKLLAEAFFPKESPLVARHRGVHL